MLQGLLHLPVWQQTLRWSVNEEPGLAFQHGQNPDVDILYQVVYVNLYLKFYTMPTQHDIYTSHRKSAANEAGGSHF